MDARRSSRAGGDAFEVDGTVASVTVLRLKTVDVARIEKQLRARGSSVQQKFPYAPVIVDLAGLDEASAMELPLHDLAERLRACKLIPVGAANLPPSAVWNAAAAGMGVIELAVAQPAPTPEPPRVEPPPADPARVEPVPVEPVRVESAPVEPVRVEPAPVEPARTEPATSTLTVRQPVRSGQVIHAHGADLVVLAAVNAGAQVIADGHIHVYGPLRGSALAGARGMGDARVFCQSLEAELVSIAGQYLLSDEIPAEHRGRPAQLWVEDGHFRIQAL